MTVIEIIQKIDEIKPNTLSQEEKMRFLTTVDQTVKKQIIDNHVGGESVGFAPYTDGTSLDRELLVPSPFDDIYLYWVAAQIDYTTTIWGCIPMHITSSQTITEGHICR